MSDLIKEAFNEAIKRYGPKGDVDGALHFFVGAAGLFTTKPTEADIKWANSVMEDKPHDK